MSISLSYRFGRGLSTVSMRVVCCFCFIASPRESVGTTTTFTYQGQLKEAGMPASGIYDLRFALYNTETGGTPGDRVVTHADTLVTNGCFSVPLDFGSSAFDGTDFWIELSVRPHDTTNDYVALTPRQAVRATPYSLFALGVRADGIAGTISDARLSPNVARLNADATFTGAVQLTNPTNRFNGMFSGDGSALNNLDAGKLTGTFNTTNPTVRGIVNYGPDIISIEHSVNHLSVAPESVIRRCLSPQVDAFGQTNWCRILRSATVVNWEYSQAVNPSGWPTTTATDYVFGFHGESVIVYLRGNGSYMGIEVDGVDDASRIYTPPDGWLHYYTIHFASYARRQITLKLSANAQFGGIYISPTNGVWPGVLPKQHRMIVVGDSFSEEITGSGWPTYLMSLFRNLDVWSSAVGSTGYLNPGAPYRVNFRDRIMADVVNYNPEFVLFAGGINDTSLMTNSAAGDALQDACVSCFRMIQTNLPGCKIIVLGPFWPRTPNDPSAQAVNQSIRNACQVAGIGSNYIDTFSDPWVTGVYNQPHSGTAVVYTSGDGTHPTAAGHWNIAYRVAAELARRFPELQPREKTR